MAALIVIDEGEWAVLGPLLARLADFGGKALLVPPAQAAALEAAKTRDAKDELFWYDFGGEPDFSLDVVKHLEGLDGAEIRRRYEEGELGMVEEQAARAYGIWPAGLEEEL